MHIICIVVINTRPRFIALYFDQPDHTAHQYGPDSLEVRTSIKMNSSITVYIKSFEG